MVEENRSCPLFLTTSQHHTTQRNHKRTSAGWRSDIVSLAGRTPTVQRCPSGDAEGGPHLTTRHCEQLSHEWSGFSMRTDFGVAAQGNDHVIVLVAAEAVSMAKEYAV